MPKLVWDIEFGPAMRTVLDVVDYAREVFDLIPEWHDAERQELQQRTKTLAETAIALIESDGCRILER